MKREARSLEHGLFSLALPAKKTTRMLLIALLIVHVSCLTMLGRTFLLDDSPSEIRSEESYDDAIAGVDDSILGWATHSGDIVQMNITIVKGNIASLECRLDEPRIIKHAFQVDLELQSEDGQIFAAEYLGLDYADRNVAVDESLCDSYGIDSFSGVIRIPIDSFCLNSRAGSGSFHCLAIN